MDGDTILLRYRGRDVRAEDIETIRAAIADAATAQGAARGYAKRGNAYREHAVPKDVWVRPLTRRWRSQLLGPESAP